MRFGPVQLASREQVHRHDRELDRQHLQAHLSVRPPAGVSQLAAPCYPVLGAALACLAPWGASVGGAVLGALARRGEAVAAAERGVLRREHQWRTAVATLRDGCSAVGGGAARVLREYSPMRGSTGGTRAARLRAWWVVCALRGARPCGACTEGHSVVVWVLGRPRSITRLHTRPAPPHPDRTAYAEPPNHSPQPIAPTTDGSGAGVAIGDRTGRILCGRRRRRRRCDASRLSQVCLFKWAGRDAAAGARPADRPGGSVSPVLSHAADAAVLRRPCAAPHCVGGMCCSGLAANKFTGTIGSWVGSISKLTSL
jgi:hypothetical protein